MEILFCAKCGKEIERFHDIGTYHMGFFQYNPFRPKYVVCFKCLQRLDEEMHDAIDNVRYNFYAQIVIENQNTPAGSNSANVDWNDKTAIDGKLKIINC